MLQLPEVNIELMQAYVRGRPAHDQLFPRFYDLVARQVVQAVQGDYPEIEPVVGPRDQHHSAAKFPELGDSVVLDWVAFGFAGMDMYDFHVGTVLNLSEWPVTYRQGLHIADHLYEKTRGKVEAINWQAAVGLTPNMAHHPAIREHQWTDPLREFDFGDVNGQATRMAQRVIAYYRVGAPIAYGLRAKL